MAKLIIVLSVLLAVAQQIQATEKLVEAIKHLDEVNVAANALGGNCKDAATGMLGTLQKIKSHLSNAENKIPGNELIDFATTFQVIRGALNRVNPTLQEEMNSKLITLSDTLATAIFDYIQNRSKHVEFTYALLNGIIPLLWIQEKYHDEIQGEIFDMGKMLLNTVSRTTSRIGIVSAAVHKTIAFIDYLLTVAKSRKKQYSKVLEIISNVEDLRKNLLEAPKLAVRFLSFCNLMLKRKNNKIDYKFGFQIEEYIDAGELIKMLKDIFLELGKTSGTDAATYATTATNNH